MNIFFFLTPKNNCTFIYEDYSIGKTLRQIEQTRFATVPILRRDGSYLGTITEGDLLWAIRSSSLPTIKESEQLPVIDVPRKKDYTPVTVTTTSIELLHMAIDQNFVPMVDDRNMFIGLVTRKKLLQYCLDAFLEKPSI